jgi:hypothetical protein
MPYAFGELLFTFAGSLPIGTWVGGYFGLSLSLTLCWILLVSIGRIYQLLRGQAAAPRFALRPKAPPLGLYLWRQQDPAFRRELSELGSGLVSTTGRVPLGSRNANMPGSERGPALHKPQRAINRRAEWDPNTGRP